MEHIKDLLHSIITGKDYNDAFAKVMADKVGNLIDSKRQEMRAAAFGDKVEESTEESKLDEEILDVATTYKRIAAKHLKDMSAKGATQQQQDYAKKMNKRALEASKMSNHTDALNHYRDVKEEAELDERELSDAEMKKREEIVKSMKKKKAGFEKRYGERAKEVMYATATKMAKHEMADSFDEDMIEESDECENALQSHDKQVKKSTNRKVKETPNQEKWVSATQDNKEMPKA